MSYLLADTHFFHNKPFIYEARGYETIEEHDASLIKNINNTIGINDIVYFLGDFSWGKHKYILDQIKVGQWHFIEGNHDKGLYNAVSNWERFKTYNKGFLELDIEGTFVVLCHYPMLSWNRSFHGSIHLFGHVHGNTPEHCLPNSYNVSMDNINNKPISFEEILKRIKKQNETGTSK